MTDDYDYLELCSCGGEPIEYIGYGYPLELAGIFTGQSIGTIIACPKCGKQTNAYREPLDALIAWNKGVYKK